MLGRVVGDLGGLGKWGGEECCEGLRKVWEKNGGRWVGVRSGGCAGALCVMVELNGKPLGDLGG